MIDLCALEDEKRNELRRLLDLIDTYESRGEKSRALETYEKLYALCKDVLGEKHLFTHTVVDGLLIQNWEYHRYIKALKYYFLFYISSFKILLPLLKEMFKLFGQIMKEKHQKKQKKAQERKNKNK